MVLYVNLVFAEDDELEIFGAAMGVGMTAEAEVAGDKNTDEAGGKYVNGAGKVQVDVFCNVISWAEGDAVVVVVNI